MAAQRPKADKATVEKVTKAVETIIRKLAKLNETNADDITGLNDRAQAELKKITAPKRAGISTRLNGAVKEAKERKAPAAEIVRRPATNEVSEIAGFPELRDNVAGLIREGMKGEIAAGKYAQKISEALLDLRLRVTNTAGRPDLKGTRQAYRDAASVIYDKAVSDLVAEGYAETVTDLSTLRTQVEEKVSYQTTAVLPQFVRSLDDSPEEAEKLFPDLFKLASDSDRKISDVLFESYKINPLSKAELAAARRLEARKAAELAAAAKDTQTGTPSTEAENSEAPTSTPSEKTAPEAMPEDTQEATPGANQNVNTETPGEEAGEAPTEDATPGQAATIPAQTTGTEETATPTQAASDLRTVQNMKATLPLIAQRAATYTGEERDALITELREALEAMGATLADMHA
ncbi:hypothetical protein ACIP5N_27680 [Streptomyces sp. NPDC088768]|uniref:hypothetical protein n=1 Tax=Streptomyces sp. NPDC088768 TaxID=3365894 RepID=UPI00382252A9